jgi:hypothetical protein
MRGEQYDRHDGMGTSIYGSLRRCAENFPVRFCPRNRLWVFLFVCSSSFGGGIFDITLTQPGPTYARCAYSANRIQSFRPKNHTIIECGLPGGIFDITLTQPGPTYARCAYSANRIQSFRTQKPVLEKLHQWKERKNGIVVVEGTWQTKVCDVVDHKRCPYPRYEHMLHFV